MKVDVKEVLSKAGQFAAPILYLTVASVVTHYAIRGVDALFQRLFSRK